MNLETQLRAELHALTDRPDAPSLDLSRVTSARRARSRRRMGLTATTAAGAAAAGVFALSAGSPAAAVQWSLATDPEAVNDRIVQLVQERLPADVEVERVRMAAFGAPDGTIDQQEDGLPDRLPESRWDEASSWSVELDLGDGHLVSVTLVHAPSEAEGDRRDNCAADLAASHYSTCEVEQLAAQGDDVEVAYRVGDVHLEHGAWMATGEADVDVTDRFVEQSLVAYPGGDFVVTAREHLAGSGEDALRDDAVLDRGDLGDIVLDPDLLSAG